MPMATLPTDMERCDGPDGTPLFVDPTEAEIGSKGPFHVAFRDEDRSRRWGYYCTNCGTFDNAMDAMGRIQCNECSNVRKPDEWDAAHE
jgi:hypothetical protein